MAQPAGLLASRSCSSAAMLALLVMGGPGS
jgi:hypothetical protein